MVFRKRRSRRSYGKAFARRRSSRSRSSGMGNLFSQLAPAFLYGAVRNPLKSAAAPLTSKIPLGNYGDEAAFGLLGYFMAKKGSGFIHDTGKAILTVEVASVANQLVSPMIQGATTSKADGWS